MCNRLTIKATKFQLGFWVKRYAGNRLKYFETTRAMSQESPSKPPPSKKRGTTAGQSNQQHHV